MHLLKVSFAMEWQHGDVLIPCEKFTQSPSFAESGCASHGKLEDTGQLQDRFTWMEDLDYIQPLRSLVNSLRTPRTSCSHLAQSGLQLAGPPYKAVRTETI